MFKKILKNQLIAGSFVLFVGSMFANFGSYLYHLLMGRMLGPVNYGVLTALISLLYIISIPALTLATTIVKFASVAKAKKNYAKVYFLFYDFSRKLLVVSVIIFILFAFGSQVIAEFLQIPSRALIILTSSLFLISLLPTVNNGILQAFLNFPFLAANSIFGVILKLALAVGLVKLGFSVGGAMMAILISSLIIYLVSFFPLRFLWQYKQSLLLRNKQSLLLRNKGKVAKIDWSKITSYAAPVFLAVLGLTSLYTTDIILVKHFFPAFQAGLYAALAVMGKIIFFASNAVPMVMFPLVSERYENGGRYRPFLSQSLILVSGLSAGITGFYFLFPKFMINILYGPSFLATSPYLGLFGIFISLYTLSSVLTSFFLSIRKTRVAFFVLSAAITQIALIWLFHASILQVIQISILVTTLLLFSLLLYYLKSEKG